MSTTFADKSGRGILLAAINRAAKNGYSFNQSDLDFAAPEATTENGKTTKVVYTATESSNYEGSQDAFFDKLDLTALFAAAGIEEVQVSAGAVAGNSHQDVANAVNARYSTGFTADDIAAGSFEPGVNEVTLIAAAGSYGYQGQLVVQLVEGKIPLAEAVDPVLGDLAYPVEVPAYLTDVVLGEGTITLKGQTANGKLLTGTGNPSTDISTSNNGEIEVGLAARIWKNGNTFAPVDGVYNVVLADDADWNWPFSIALLQEARPVTDLYDVTLTIKADDNGSVLPFTLHRSDDGVMHFVNEEHDLDINDNAVSEAGDVVQNIQRVRFYEQYLGDLPKNTAGSPLGNFTLSLSAVRREGLVPPVEVSVGVNVSLAETQPA